MTTVDEGREFAEPDETSLLRGVGPKTPLEGVREHIEEAVVQLTKVFSPTGIDLEGWADLLASDPISMEITLDGDVVVVRFKDRKPQVHALAGFIKSNVHGIRAGKDEIVVELAGMPDVTFKVGS
jgi:hypothetical protein